MRQHKSSIAFLAWLTAVATFSYWEPIVPKSWLSAVSALLVLAPVAFFLIGLGRFHKWHRVWHLWLINEAMKPGRRSGE